MTNKSLIQNILSVAGLLLCMLLTVKATTATAYAYSASVNFLPEREEVRVGDEFYVSLEVSADITPGSFEGFISYDSTVLEYMDGPLCVSGSEGVLKLNDQNSDSSKNTRKYLLYFRAASMGYATFSMLGEPQVYDYDTGLPMPISVSEVTIKVIAAREASSDSSLALLKISPGTLSPSFDPDTLEYSTKVDETTENLIVSAMTSDSEAKVIVKGSRLVNPGRNTVTVTVTAQDGSETVYTLTVMRGDAVEGSQASSGTGTKAASSDPALGTAQEGSSTEGTSQSAGSESLNKTGAGANSDPSSDSRFSGTSFYASEIGGTLLLNSSVQYRICDDTEGVRIPSDYSPVTITISGYRVTAYEKKDGSEPDFLLMVLESEGGTPSLYRYDRVEKTVQRYTAESSTEGKTTKATGVENSGKTANTENSKEVKSKSDNSVLIVTLICLGCIAVIAALIWLNLRKASPKGTGRSGRSSSASGRSGRGSYSGSSGRSSGRRSGR